MRRSVGGYEFPMRVATCAGSRVERESKAVKHGAQRQDRDDQDGQLKVMELGCRGGMASGVSDEAQGDSADRDSHA